MGTGKPGKRWGCNSTAEQWSFKPSIGVRFQPGLPIYAAMEKWQTQQTQNLPLKGVSVRIRLAVPNKQSRTVKDMNVATQHK